MTIDRRKLLFLSAGAGALAVGGYGLMQRPGQPTGLLPVGAAHAQTDDEAELPEIQDMVLGDPDAPVTLIEYASFTCPHCATFHANVTPRLKEDFIEPGHVRFIYREVYFDRPGLWAGMVARCGGPLRYFGIVDLIYERQREWTQGSPAEVADNLRTIGRTAGLTNAELDACLTDAGMAQAMINAYEANVAVHEIAGTPALVLNDQVMGNMSYADLSGLLDDALAEAGVTR